MCEIGSKVAVVTGSNKGIGYAIVKGLCQKFDGKVYLTARDENRGIDAVNKLKKLGLNPIYHQLDISNQNSINKFRDYILETEGGIDVLVNNAAIAYKVNDTVPFSEQANNTIDVNYFGFLDVCVSLFPILRPNAQVVNITSSCGHLSRIPSSDLRSKFGDPNLTIANVNELMLQFIKDANEGKSEERGWGTSAYGVSKVGKSAVTIIQQRDFNTEQANRNISVNCVHPGYVATDMSSHKGTLTADEGARAPLFLALEPHGWKGQYVWKDSTVVDWYGPGTPEVV